MTPPIMSESLQDNAKRKALTDREREVWQWIAEGKSNWEIGHILGCAEQTAKKHVQHICGKLNVPNRAAAAAIYGRESASVSPSPTDPVSVADTAASAAQAPNRRPLADIWP
jgi:DNA-binding CsgD family transcriptional regulator